MKHSYPQLSLHFVPLEFQPAVPVGFKLGMLPGTVTPLAGTHAGSPMYPGTALFEALCSDATNRIAPNNKGSIVR